jgi:Mg-chelatase subunit ChlD
VTVKLKPKKLYEMPSEEIPELDLVMVLDVRESMKGEKLEKMKTAMLYFIQKFDRIFVIRLSIVTFGTKAKRQCGLCPVTEISGIKLINLIYRLEADGYTSISNGLQMGLKVLLDRRSFTGRATCIMLVSGSNDVIGDAAPVPTGYVSVHTFGLGKDYNRTVLTN